MSHVAKDMAYSWFSGCRYLELLGPFGPFPGHVMDLEGRKELVTTAKSSRMWKYPPFPFVWLF